MKIVLPLIIVLTVYATARGSIGLNDSINHCTPQHSGQTLPSNHQLPWFL